MSRLSETYGLRLISIVENAQDWCGWGDLNSHALTGAGT